MTDKDALLMHLTLFVDTENPVRFTSFTAALRDARGITKRNPDNGEPNPNVKHGHVGSWLGALGYLVLLDHIGTCFKRKGGEELPPKTSSVVKALTYFSRLEHRKILAIYALRCAFAHEYGLSNFHADPLLQHHFVVTAGSGELIRFPPVAWNRDFENAGRDATTVDLWELGDLVESVCSNLLTIAHNDGLEIALEGGIPELQNRFWLMSPMKPA